MALKSGKTVIYPTDTLYGIGCDSTNQKARQKIYSIKGRSLRKQLPVIVADIKMAEKYFLINRETKKFLKEIWPGPISVVLNTKNGKIAKLLGGRTVVVRVPAFILAAELVKELGRPMVSTSANVSDKATLRDSGKIIKQFKKTKPDLVLDAGILPGNKPSTILDLTKYPKIKILRYGAGVEKFKKLL